MTFGEDGAIVCMKIMLLCARTRKIDYGILVLGLSKFYYHESGDSERGESYE